MAKEIDDALAGRGVKVVPSGQASATAKTAQQGGDKASDEVQPTGKDNPKPPKRHQHWDRR